MAHLRTLTPVIEPLRDDWYRATEPYASMREMQNDEIPIYSTSEAASPLGCASQWQFCNTETSACSPTVGCHDAILGSAQAFGVNVDGPSKSRSRATDRLAWLMESTGIRYSGEGSILLNLQDSALLVKQSLMESSLREKEVLCMAAVVPWVISFK